MRARTAFNSGLVYVVVSSLKAVVLLVEPRIRDIDLVGHEAPVAVPGGVSGDAGGPACGGAVAGLHRAGAGRHGVRRHQGAQVGLKQCQGLIY